MIETWVFFVAQVSIMVGFGLLFAWFVIRGERHERRIERDYQRLLEEQTADLEREYGHEIQQLKNEMHLMKGENDKLQAQVNALTGVLVKVQQHIGINITAGDDVTIGEFVGANKQGA